VQFLNTVSTFAEFKLRYDDDDEYFGDHSKQIKGISVVFESWDCFPRNGTSKFIFLGLKLKRHKLRIFC